MSKETSLCIFANFSIDSEERFTRLRESYYSIRGIPSEEWRINIRGRFKYEVGEFLRQELSDKVTVYFLSSERGWFRDSIGICSTIRSSYVLIWIEDHLCQTDGETINQCISEMRDLGADQLLYSWFHAGTRQVYDSLPRVNSGKLINVVRIDRDSSLHTRLALGKDFYAVSLLSIMSKEFFLKILNLRRPILKRWSIHLPFDFEKKSVDIQSDVIFSAIPMFELFASIDDDHGNVGYSLISRGEYAERVTRTQLRSKEYLRYKSRFLIHLKRFPIFRSVWISVFYAMLRRFGYTVESIYSSSHFYINRFLNPRYKNMR